MRRRKKRVVRARSRKFMVKFHLLSQQQVKLHLFHRLLTQAANLGPVTWDNCYLQYIVVLSAHFHDIRLVPVHSQALPNL